MKVQASELQNGDQTHTRKHGLFSYLLSCIFHLYCLIVVLYDLLPLLPLSLLHLCFTQLEYLWEQLDQETCREKGACAFDGSSS